MGGVLGIPSVAFPRRVCYWTPVRVRERRERAFGGAPRRVVFETRSALSGSIRVVDRGDERRLIAGGDLLSIIPLSGDWSRLGREYWSRALDAVALPRRPTALFVGAGGGTQLRLLSSRARPRWMTVVERDPVILQVARRYFGLGGLEHAEFLCADIERALPGLEAARRRYDFIMEDAMYSDPVERALPVALRLAALVGRRGALVLNRHARRHAAQTAAALRERFSRVTMRRVRRGGENMLICARALKT